MLSAFLRRGLAALPFDWLLARPCPLCRRLPSPGDRSPGACTPCRRDLDLPAVGLSGGWPLPWWSSSSYAGGLRRVLLQQKQHGDGAAVEALLEPLQRALAPPLDLLEARRLPILVPIPSWKRRGNPLPGLIADGLGRRLGLARRDLLERSRVVLVQHRLGRQLRQTNQQGAFRCRQPAAGPRPLPLLIVDDILTTGATACNAALCLKQAGWPVLGLVCLARTPGRGRSPRAVI